MIFYPHKIKGKFKKGKNVSGLKKCKIDNTGDIIIGNSVIFSEDSLVYTHSHYTNKNDTIVNQTKKHGVKINSLIIEDDVFIGARAIILSSVTKIPKGTMIAAGAVLIKNPIGEYGIYGGVPAKKIGERK